MALKDICPVLEFAELGDERGQMVVVEGNQAIPFDIKRVFYIYGSDATVVRGQHANRESAFVLINVAGQSKVRITDGTDEVIVELNKPRMGVYIPKMIWKDMYDFSADSVLLVLASTHYDGKEYIRNYEEYLEIMKGAEKQNPERIHDAENEPIVSLCIPTNGVIPWVFPVLDSIYAQGVDPKLYEVVVMDNGQNAEFKQLMREYAAGRENLVYRETDAYEFMSEIETYKAASGKFIKFINHRTKLRPGALMAFIQFAIENEAAKPVIYFRNNALPIRPQEIVKLNSFDGFVKELSYLSSWSTGMAFWKSSFDSIPDLTKTNALFPHTLILFSDRTNREYIIDNRELLEEIPVGNIPKGRYNLFNAFAVEYPSIILDLYLSKDISKETFLYVKKQNLDFLRQLWFDFILLKKPCSYDLTQYKASIPCFYSMFQVRMGVFRYGIKFIRDRLAFFLGKIPVFRLAVSKIRHMLFPKRCA